MKTLRVVAAIIEKDNKILIARRLKGEFKDLWEFPGGKYEEGETGEQAIKREIEEEFDAEIEVKDLVTTVEYQYPEFYLVMDCYKCELISKELHLHDHTAFKWIVPNEEINDWVPADRNVIREYLNYARKGH